MYVNKINVCLRAKTSLQSFLLHKHTYVHLHALVTAKLLAVSILSTCGIRLKGASVAFGLVLWRKIASRNAVYSWSVFLMNNPPRRKMRVQKDRKDFISALTNCRLRDSWLIYFSIYEIKENITGSLFLYKTECLFRCVQLRYTLPKVLHKYALNILFAAVVLNVSYCVICNFDVKIEGGFNY